MIARSALFMLGVSSVALTGCLSTNTFGSARTLNKGEMSHTLGATVYAFDEGDGTTPVPGLMPVYGVRVGMSDEIDVGGQFSGPGNLRADLKYNPLRTKYFDLAVAPAFWFAVFNAENADGDEGMAMFGVDAPVILNLNAGESISFVPWLGPGFGYHATTQYGGWFLRGGFGVQWRVTDGLFIQPEVSTVFDPIRGAPVDLAMGLGFGFGDRPRYR